jgi:pyruvate formate lyase activating enzyme
LYGETIPTEEFFDFLASRAGRLEGVCISGGEPTMMADLSDFIRRIKSMGFLVKLDTNGSHPDALRRLIDDNLLDYVAMDIKNSPEKYEKTAGVASSEMIFAVKESVTTLLEGRVPYEFRTTVMSELHSSEDMAKIGRWLSGAERYFLQNYRPEGDLIVGGFTPLTAEEMQGLLTEVKKYIPTAAIRG